MPRLTPERLEQIRRQRSEWPCLRWEMADELLEEIDALQRDIQQERKEQA